MENESMEFKILNEKILCPVCGSLCAIGHLHNYIFRVACGDMNRCDLRGPLSPSESIAIKEFKKLFYKKD